MSKLRQTTTPKATTTTTVEVKLAPKLHAMLMERLKEYANLAAVVKEYVGTKKQPGRMKRIGSEIEDIFIKAKQGKALADGCRVEGFSVKLVSGSHSKFDKIGFMKKHGLTEEDFAEFTTTHDSTPYIKITAPGASDED